MNVRTERATPFPASTIEKWQPTTDRYRSNIRKRWRPPSANSRMGTYRTSCDPAPAFAVPNAFLARRIKHPLDVTVQGSHDPDPREHRRAAASHHQQRFNCRLPLLGLVLGFRELCDVGCSVG